MSVVGKENRHLLLTLPLAGAGNRDDRTTLVLGRGWYLDEDTLDLSPVVSLRQCLQQTSPSGLSF